MVYVWGWGGVGGGSMWRSKGNFWRWFSPSIMDTSTEFRLSCLSAKCLYPLSHLSASLSNMDVKQHFLNKTQNLGATKDLSLIIENNNNNNNESHGKLIKQLATGGKPGRTFPTHITVQGLSLIC